MGAKLMTALGLFFTASPVLADEVLYCVDTTGAVGFAWGKNGDAKSSKFNPTVKKGILVIPLDFQRDNTRVEDSAVIHDM